MILYALQKDVFHHGGKMSRTLQDVLLTTAAMKTLPYPKLDVTLTLCVNG
jgi:hypothetical protein